MPNQVSLTQKSASSLYQGISRYFSAIPSLYEKIASFNKPEFNIAFSCHDEVLSWIVLERKNSHHPKVVSWGIDTDSQALAEDILKISSFSRDRMYVSGYLPGSKSLFRKVLLPVTVPSKNRMAALIDTIEGSFAQPISLSSDGEAQGENSLELASWVRNEGDTEIRYDAFIASKKDIQSAYHHLSENCLPAIQPVEIIFPKGACLHAWASKTLSNEEPALIVDISGMETVSILYVNGEIELMRCIPIGLEAFQSIEEEEKKQDGDISSSLKMLLQSLVEVREAAHRKIEEKSPSSDTPKPQLSLVLTGPIACSPLYTKIAAEFLDLPEKNVDHIEPDCTTESVSQVPLRTVASEYGAALLGSEKTMFSAHPESIPAFPFKSAASQSTFMRHAQKPFYMLLGASLCISILIVLWGNIKESHIQAAAQKELREFTQTMLSQPLFENEREIIRKIDNSLLSSETQERNILLSDLEQQIQKRSTFPLEPRSPSFSKTLLACDALILSVNATEGLDKASKIQLQTFKYSMIKRPDIKRPKERYQVRVDIEFTAPTQTLARKFYDALLQSKELVDKESDIKWSVSHGRYKTSFFLRNKPSLPPIQRSWGE